jgi:hypothetical protein
MTFPERRVQIDAFNDLDYPLCYMVTNVELMAEGVSLVGANYVWIESPVVSLEKLI